jgi:hypothetical protein
MARGGCPWHHSKSGTAFYIDTETLLWRCPACGRGGGPVQYLHQLAGGSGSPRGQTFLGVVRRLADMAGVPFPERQPTEEDIKREARRSVLETDFLLCRRELWSDGGASAREYLHTRGFTDADLEGLEVGLHPPAEKVLAAVRLAGYDEALARECGVLGGRMVGYCTFPWRDVCGRALTIYGTWPDRTPTEASRRRWRSPTRGSGAATPVRAGSRRNAPRSTSTGRAGRGTSASSSSRASSTRRWRRRGARRTLWPASPRA